MSGVFSVNTIVTVFGVKLKTIPKTVVVFLQAFLSASARSRRLNCPRVEADVAYFNSLQREAGDSNFAALISTSPNFNPLQREAGDFFRFLHPIFYIQFQSTPARSRRPSKDFTFTGAQAFQSTPARSRRQQLLPIFIYIPHISLYKSTNILYSPPHSSTNPSITMRFFQCESPKKLMSTYVSHHQSTISL